MKSLILALLFTVFAATASDCPQHYQGGINPTTQGSNELCYSEFAVGYNADEKHAIYAAEHITREELLAAKELTRKDAFHEETMLPVSARITNSDYRSSGFDRGHLAPNADMPTVQAQFESFSLANMVPQLHHNNAGIWLQIEKAVRQSAMKYNDVYTVTGAIYGETPPMLKGRLPVPGALFKAVYIPQTNQASAYVSDNSFSGQYSVISIEQLKGITGFDPFPALPDSIKGDTTQQTMVNN